MTDRDLEAEKLAATELLANAYARDIISIEELENRLGAVTDAESIRSVRDLVGDVGPLPLEPRAAGGCSSLPVSPQLIRGSMQSLRREGRWLRSRRIVVVQTGSSIRLDLAEIADHPGQTFELELALKGCSCKIRVPKGTRVDDRLEPHFSSYRCSRSVRRNEDSDGATLVITGRMAASSVRVSPGRGRDR